MAGPLRNLARQTANSLLRADRNAGLQQQQRRWAGDLPVKNNKYIENWATFRENVEDTFTFDTRTVALLAVFMVGVPVLIYNTIVSEYDLADEKAGRKKKDFM